MSQNTTGLPRLSSVHRSGPATMTLSKRETSRTIRGRDYRCITPFGSTRRRCTNRANVQQIAYDHCAAELLEKPVGRCGDAPISSTNEDIGGAFNRRWRASTKAFGAGCPGRHSACTNPHPCRSLVVIDICARRTTPVAHNDGDAQYFVVPM